MPTVTLVEYEDASPEVREVYDDFHRLRGDIDIPSYWKAIAHHPQSLKRAWTQFRDVMQPGALDTLSKEMIYLAVSATNRCDFCIEAHTNLARKLGMTEQMLGELMEVVALANGLNAYGAGYQVRPSDLAQTSKK